MSTINNLHSLLSGKWMITDEAENSLYPFLLNILNKGALPEQDSNKLSAYYMSASQDIFDEEAYENVEEEEREQVVAILPIKGPILKYSQWCGPEGTKSLQTRLDRFKADDNVIAVLLDMDSGGGQAAGTREFARYINSYPKLIESYTDGGIASAAYLIASATNKINVNPNADYIGSIGTMYKTLILDGYFEKIGAKVVEEYATKSKKKNNAYRELKKGNPEVLIKEELDPFNNLFHADVQEYRPGMSEEVFDGHHTLIMKDAQDKGLIDVIADKKTVINNLFESAKKEQSQKESNQNQIDMADQEVSLEQISATLNIEGGLKLSSKLLGGKKGAFLTVEQLEVVENKLSNHADALAKVEGDLETANTLNTGLKNAVTAALETTSLEAEETPEASIKMLGDKVVEYGGQSGQVPTSSKTDGDRQEVESQLVIETDNHNEIYNKA